MQYLLQAAVADRNSAEGTELNHSCGRCVGFARVISRRGIDCYVAFVDMLDDSGFVDDKCGPITKALRLVEDAVILNYCSFEVAEEWESDADVLCKTFVGRNTVDANTKDLGFSTFEFGDISLICL